MGPCRNVGTDCALRNSINLINGVLMAAAACQTVGYGGIT